MTLPGPPSRLRSLVTAAVWCLVSLNFGLQASIVGPSASILAQQAHTSEARLAPVLGMGGLCMLVGGTPAGWLVDHVPGNTLLAITLVLQAVGYAAMPWCNSILLLALVYGAIGLTFNVVNTGVNVMAIWQFENPRHLGVILNSLSAAFGLGGMVAPQLVTSVLGHGYAGQLCFYLTAIVTLAVAVLVAPLPSPLKPGSGPAISSQADREEGDEETSSFLGDADGSSASGSDDEDKQLIVIEGFDEPVHSAARQLHRTHSNPGSGASTPRGQAGSQHGSQTGYWTPSRHSNRTPSRHSDRLPVHSGKAGGAGAIKPQVDIPLIEAATPVPAKGRPWLVLVPALLVAFFNVSVEIAVGGWVFMYAKEVSHMTLEAAEGTASLYWGVFTGGRVLAAVLASCVPTSWLLLASMPLAVAGALWALVDVSGTATCGAVVLIALGVACGFPCTLSLAAEVAELDGAMNGVISMVAGLAMTVMPSVVPWLAAHDPSRGFGFLMIATLVCAVLQLVFLLQLLWARHVVKARAGALARRMVDAQQQQQSRDDDLTAPLLLSVH